MLEKKHVLIVDDTPSNIKILNDMLKKNYTLSAATNGLKALAIATGEQQPDLILLDVVMPVMDGFKLCKKLKENDTTRQIPVVFITGCDDITEDEKGYELGAAGVLHKPIQPEKLMSVITGIIQ